MATPIADWSYDQGEFWNDDQEIGNTDFLDANGDFLGGNRTFDFDANDRTISPCLLQSQPIDNFDFTALGVADEAPHPTDLDLTAYDAGGSIHTQQRDGRDTIAGPKSTAGESFRTIAPSLHHGLDIVADPPTQDHNSLRGPGDVAPELPQGKPRSYPGDSSAALNRRSNLPQEAQKRLQNLLQRMPYPSKDEKQAIAVETGISVKQVGTWLNNQRSRAQQKLKSIRRTASTPDFQGASIPAQNGYNPMQRFLTTPPEDDPAPIAVIAAAAQQMEVQSTKRKLMVPGGMLLDIDSRYLPDIYDGADYLPPKPATDQGYDSISMSGLSDGNSAGSADSRTSHASWAGRRGRKKIRIAFSNPRTRQGDKIYQCTWCYKAFNRPDAWKRHEESEHCPQKEWVCMPNDPTEGHLYCVFCGPLVDASVVEHYNKMCKHSAFDCFAKEQKQRSFARKDGLLQHLKQKHGLKTIPAKIHYWSRPLTRNQRGWMCGFCHCWQTDWDSRAKHIGQHFRDGYDMTSWEQLQVSDMISSLV